MSLFDVLSLVGGLALFLYGMHVLGEGLAKASGGRLEQILEKLTSNLFKAVALGTVVTAVIQSSSATTVMVVGFVNSGIMKLSQAVGIIMGANIGTTMTSWILSLSGIEGENFVMQLLKPTSFSPVLAIIGVGFILFSKKEVRIHVGTILIGFAVLMFGMDMMSSAVAPLADVPEFTSILTLFSNPILGMLVGTGVTALIQSSSASVGILQALCVTGAVRYSTALPIIMGQNIGTCVTALISAIGAKKNAKRAAFIHLYFNLIGTIVFMVLFYTVNTFVHFSFLGDSANAAGIAVIHTSFNVFATCILLPFNKLLVKLACLTVRDQEEPEEKVEGALALLDSRFLEQPGLAVAQSRQAAVEMAYLSKKSLELSMGLLSEYDDDVAKEVRRLEDQVDRYEDALSTYLVRLGNRSLSSADSYTVSILLHALSDWERISDHAVNVQISAKNMAEKGMSFSEKAKEELEIFGNAVKDIVNISAKVFESGDLELAKRVEPLEEVIDGMNTELKERHIRRLRKGKCTAEMGFVLSDVTTDYERVADHCSNIAVYFLEAREQAMDSHGYLRSLRKSRDEEFEQMTDLYQHKYVLP